MYGFSSVLVVFRGRYREALSPFSTSLEMEIGSGRLDNERLIDKTCIFFGVEANSLLVCWDNRWLG